MCAESNGGGYTCEENHSHQHSSDVAGMLSEDSTQVKGYDSPGLHEPSEEDIAAAMRCQIAHNQKEEQHQIILKEEEKCEVENSEISEHLELSAALIAAIKSTAKNPQEAL